MILSPTKDYIATLTPTADYTVSLPDVRLNLEPAKTVSSDRTISGGATISVWPANIGGENRTFDVSVPLEFYQTLKRIKDSAADEWLLRVRGRVFVVIFDMPSAIVEKGLSGRWNCTLSLTFSEEVIAS